MSETGSNVNCARGKEYEKVVKGRLCSPHALHCYASYYDRIIGRVRSTDGAKDSSAGSLGFDGMVWETVDALRMASGTEKKSRRGVGKIPLTRTLARAEKQHGPVLPVTPVLVSRFRRLSRGAFLRNCPGRSQIGPRALRHAPATQWRADTCMHCPGAVAPTALQPMKGT